MRNERRNIKIYLNYGEQQHIKKNCRKKASNRDVSTGGTTRRGQK